MTAGSGSTDMGKRQKCHHHYPRLIEPWDVKKLRCVGCGQPAPERIQKAVYNVTRTTRTRRAVRQAWADFEENRP